MIEPSFHHDEFGDRFLQIFVEDEIHVLLKMSDEELDELIAAVDAERDETDGSDASDE